MKSKLCNFLVMLSLGLVFSTHGNAAQRTVIPKSQRKIHVDKDAIIINDATIQVALSFGTFAVTKLGIDESGRYYVYESDLLIAKSKHSSGDRYRGEGGTHCSDCDRDFTSEKELSFHKYTNHIYPRRGQEGQYR